MTQSQYGNVVWGHSEEKAKNLIGARSAQELTRLGLTVEKAKEWRDFYKAVSQQWPNNTAAASRVALMDDIIQTLGGS